MLPRSKIILASSLGTLIEWAEFSFYAYLLAQFSHLFFSMLTHEAALIAAFGTFAVSYLARPLGGIFFGYIGDKFGRQKALVGSILLMGFVTLAMGLLPTYQQIGTTAPLLLIALRFLQGVAVAGEFMGAGVLVVENDTQAPYFSSSWISTAAAGGMLLGGFAGIVVSLPNMPDWAWRVPFWIGFLSCGVGFYIRFALSETTEYQALLHQQRVTSTPIKTLLQDHRISLLKTFLFAALIGIFIYICNIWWVTYVIERGYFSPLAARTLATSAQAGVVILTPIMGWVAQRWQASKVMSLGLFGTLITAPLLLLLAGKMSFHSILLVELLYALSLAALTAPMLKYLANLFPTAVRYSGQAIGWNMAVAVFGGTAPLVAQLLSSQQSTLALAGYVVGTGLIALLVNQQFSHRPLKG